MVAFIQIITKNKYIIQFIFKLHSFAKFPLIELPTRRQSITCLENDQLIITKH